MKSTHPSSRRKMSLAMLLSVIAVLLVGITASGFYIFGQLPDQVPTGNNESDSQTKSASNSKPVVKLPTDSASPTSDDAPLWTDGWSGVSSSSSVVRRDVPLPTSSVAQSYTTVISLANTSSLDLSEGSAGSAQVSLTSAPSSTYRVTLSTHDSRVHLSQTTIDFTQANWQGVAVNFTTDDDMIAQTTSTFTMMAAAQNSPTASISIPLLSDDLASVVALVWCDPESVLVDQVYLDKTLYETANICAVLTSQPTSNVYIDATLYHYDGYTGTRDGGTIDDLDLSDTQLAFTAENWNTPQAITVSSHPSITWGDISQLEFAVRPLGSADEYIVADPAIITIYTNSGDPPV